MRAVCNTEDCPWTSSSASNLSELSFIFQHGPVEGHSRGTLYDDDNKILRGLIADDIYLRSRSHDAW